MQIGRIAEMFVDAGFFPPTSGTAIVNGFDIRHDIDKVRRSLGLCPQHNILFDDLTVQEHLIFFTKVFLIRRLLQFHMTVYIYTFMVYHCFGKLHLYCLNGLCRHLENFV